MARGKKRTHAESSPPAPTSASPKKAKKSEPDDSELRFIGTPVPSDVAKSRWSHRYQSRREKTIVVVTLSDGSTEEKELYQARCHYTKASIDGEVFELFDDAYCQGEEDCENIGKIVELFETIDGENYMCTRWFYRAKDTVIKGQDSLIDARRLFYSDIKDDNPIGCVIRKAKINQITTNMSAAARIKAMALCDFYVDMMYTFPHAFTSLFTEISTSSFTTTTGSIETKTPIATKSSKESQQSELTLLDLYSGCGAMSTGLGIGASLLGEKVVTRWAVDFNSNACESLKSNHPDVEVRNEDAENYFVLLKEWEKLCKEFNVVKSENAQLETQDIDSDESEVDNGGASPGEFEVQKFIGICYGDPNKHKKAGLYLKVRWKGYGSADDTWEPIDGLSNCKETIKEFVSRGYRARLLPLPGDVDFICGGPPCQGISGFNRYRNYSDPLEDKKNRQLVVYMDIVEFLKPRFVLMENVTDILKFSKAVLTSYAVGRLVSMQYQTRLGIMAAGAYGVPQCRMRFFLWGARSTESLPQFPLPTHQVMKKGVVINEFKELIIGHGDEHCELHNTSLLGDAISDLPEVTNDADWDEMQYGTTPKTAFQKFIRLSRQSIFGSDAKRKDSHKCILYDHRPHRLNADDYERVCHIPKFKGACFRNLPGVLVEPKKSVRLDPSVERALCKSGKPLVPDYAITFESGRSCKPFGRLGMDDIVATVVTRPEPHNQVLLHPKQDRVLSVRENARLQGFPDCYKLYGPIRERYIQVGNAVSFSVSIPLGYCLAKALQGAKCTTPISLPFTFPECLGKLKSLRENPDEIISE